MRFLRMLSNSAIAGALASMYLTVLVLHLNPAYPLSLDALVPLALVLWVAYGINIAVVFYALIVLRQIAAAEVLSPGWLSVRLLSWLCTIAAGTGALLMWLNLRSFGAVLDAPTVSRMTAGALTLSGSAIVFLFIALAHVGRRGGRVSAGLLVLAMVLSVVAPVVARRQPAEARLVARPVAPVVPFDAAKTDGRIILLMLDGASLDVISPAVAEGRLPSFGRMLDAGSVLHLATLRPTQAESVWSAAATGRVPLANGVRAAALYRVRDGWPALSLLPDYCFAQALVTFGFLAEERHTSRSLQARPVWSILTDARVDVGIVGWPLTHPAPAVNGFLVTDVFHGLSETDAQLEIALAVSPPEMLPDITAALNYPATPDPLSLVSTTARARLGDADPRHDPAPVVADRVHMQILDLMLQRSAASLLAVRFPGLDAIAHYFLRYANPGAFGDVSEEERRQHGRVLGEYYGFLDTIVGRVMNQLRPDDLLLVVSGFGMEPLSPGKRVLEQLVGNGRLSGTHERAPDGFLMAYGASVAPGRPRRGSILDVTPTILYYLGLPVGRDMEGFARADLFRASFTGSRPITFIPSYGR